MFLIPLGVYILVLFGYPLYYSVSMSFKNLNQITLINGNANFVGFQNYIQAWSSSIIWRSFLNTIQFTVVSIIMQFVIGLLVALLFNRRFPLNRVLRSLILVPWLIPQIVSGAIFNWMFSSTNGVVNQILLDLHIVSTPVNWLLHPESALIVMMITNIWIGVPFNMVLLYSGLQDIPREIYEAAAIDGARGVRSFFYVTLPNLKVIIGIVLMLGLIYTLKVFDIVMSLTQGGPANMTQLLSSWSYTLSFTNLNFGQGAAVANGLIVISLVFTAIYLWINRKTAD